MKVLFLASTFRKPNPSWHLMKALMEDVLDAGMKIHAIQRYIPGHDLPAAPEQILNHPNFSDSEAPCASVKPSNGIQNEPMKLLKLSPYYFPESISSSHLSGDLEEAYIQAGFEIHVFAPTPTRGISDEVYDQYKDITYEERRDGYVKVRRFRMFREGKNPMLRAVRYMLVHLRQYQCAIKEPDIDVISAGSTPPTQGMLCALVKRKLSKRYGRNVPLIFALHDVFPDSLVNAGMTKKGSLVWKLGRKVEDYTYRNADKIIVISEDIKRNIIDKGVPEEKIQLIYNWIDTEAVHPVAWEDNALAKELELRREDFHVVYAGNLGKAQGVGVILDAAQQLKNRKDIKFLIFGNGAEEENIRTAIETEQLTNVELYPLQPAARVAEVYSLGDVCIVACKKGNGVNAFPSKTVSIMATATPVLASFDLESELCRLMERHHCGVCCAPEDGAQMKDAILRLAGDLPRVSEMGQNARILIENRFEKTNCTREYVRLIHMLCDSNGSFG